jgi:hypothetical protein
LVSLEGNVQRHTGIAKQQQSFIEKKFKQEDMLQESRGSLSSGLRATPVAQESWCLGFKGNLYIIRGD